jgi:uncharacterized protein YjbJ (UPF0337 family)
MGWLDKILGRTKSTAGEAMGSPELREEGRSQEAAAQAEARAEQHEERAQEERERAAAERPEEEPPS